MSPEPSSIYTTPSYLRDKFHFDPDQGKFSTFKDNPQYKEVQEEVDRSNSSLANYPFDFFSGRPNYGVAVDNYGNAYQANVGSRRHLISGNYKDEPSVLDFMNDLAAARKEDEYYGPNPGGTTYTAETIGRMDRAMAQRRNQRLDDEAAAVNQAVDQENKDRRYQSDVGQGRSSDELIARAFSGPAAGTAPIAPLRSPEEQRAARDSQRHAMAADFHGGLPTRAVTLAGMAYDDVMDQMKIPESFKQSMSFRPGMEFGTPKSQPTAIGANATGIGAAPPERKKQNFMDWLRSNLPDSFSDPNSMYYFPGKYY
jgi:hypothetical protein